MQLNGKTALVTGGGIRIGKALSLALARRGVRVAVHYGTSAAAARETVDEINRLGSEADLFPADLRRTETLDGLVASVAERFGGIDILVNSAAIFLPGDLDATTESSWDAHFAVNLKAPFFLCQAFARRLKGEGQIVNIADWRAVRPGGEYLAYTLTKSGIVTMTQSLAQALAPAVRVNAIAPGAILPPPGRDAAYLDGLAARIPLRRTGSPDDVAGALLYFLEADFVTGQTLFVNGGEHL